MRTQAIGTLKTQHESKTLSLEHKMDSVSDILMDTIDMMRRQHSSFQTNRAGFLEVQVWLRERARACACARLSERCQHDVVTEQRG